MKAILFASVVLLSFSSSVLGDELLPIATEIVQKAKSECANIEGVKFNATEQTHCMTSRVMVGQKRLWTPPSSPAQQRFPCGAGPVGHIYG